ncbi:DUF883 family protein [Roseibium algae]|uniref:DUF883 domain-containing protein n=1 Tax=Roseibium algae TaxID=3123038 RepID=A0ABU8TIS9_9HYPH
MATAKSASSSSSANSDEAVTAREIEENIKRIRSDISALAGSLKKFGEGKADEYKTRASEAGDDLTKMSEEALEDLTADLQAYERALVAHVRKHPLQSIGIAVGVGFLLSALLRR